MGAAATTVFSAAVDTPPPFANFSDPADAGRLLLRHQTLSQKTLRSLPPYIYFRGVHTLVLEGTTREE